MLKFVQKLFGSKNEKDVKDLLPIVDQINEEYATLPGNLTFPSDEVVKFLV